MISFRVLARFRLPGRIWRVPSCTDVALPYNRVSMVEPAVAIVLKRPKSTGRGHAEHGFRGGFGQGKAREE